MDIDVNQLANSLNAKIDLPQGLNQSQIDYVIDWKAPTEDDPTWYRVYKSGWVEQGGIFSGSTTVVTFSKEMRDTKYYIGVTSVANSSDVGAFVYSRTTTTADFRNCVGTDTPWQVSGQGAN